MFFFYCIRKSFCREEKNIMIYKKKFLQGERLKRLNKTDWIVQIILGKYKAM